MMKVLFGALLAFVPLLFMLSFSFYDRYHSLPACQKRAQRWLKQCYKGKLDKAFEIESLLLKFREIDLLPDAHDRSMYWQFIRRARICRRRELIVRGKELLRVCRAGYYYPFAGELMVTIIRNGEIDPRELGTSTDEVEGFYALHCKMFALHQLYDSAA